MNQIKSILESDGIVRPLQIRESLGKVSLRCPLNNASMTIFERNQ
jgi:hypothetical protein